MKTTTRILVALAWHALVIGAAQAASWDVPPELWEKPRTGAEIRTQTSLRECVTMYIAEPGSQILIHHDRSEESQLRAEELRAWLISLAVEAERTALAEDLKINQNLRVELVIPTREAGKEGTR